MKLLITTLLIFIFIFIFIILLSTLVSIKDYKYYAEIYKTLENRKFYKNYTQVYSYKFGEEDDGFVWFLNDNSFKLNQSVYIHANSIVHFDPYSLYWLIKYRKWFKKNVNIEELPFF